MAAEANDESGTVEGGESAGPARGGRFGPASLAGMAAVAIAAGVLGGYLATLAPVDLLAAATGGGESAGEDGQRTSGSAGSSGSAEQKKNLTYYELDSFVANLNAPRMSRYVRAKPVLVVRKKDLQEVKKTIGDKKPTVMNWLTTYMASQHLDDVRGGRNINRIRRRIKDELNARFWSDKRPRIQKVIFNKFAVQ